MKNTLKFSGIIAFAAIFMFSLAGCDSILDNTTVKLTNLLGETITFTELELMYVDKILWSGSVEIADGETKSISFRWEKEDWGHPIVKIIRQDGTLDNAMGGLSLTIEGGKTNKLYVKWVDFGSGIPSLRLSDSDEGAIRKNIVTLQ